MPFVIHNKLKIYDIHNDKRKMDIHKYKTKGPDEINTRQEPDVEQPEPPSDIKHMRII